jgi:hypothetical protein
MLFGARRWGDSLLLLAVLLCLFVPDADGSRIGFAEPLASGDESAAYKPPATVEAFIAASATNDKATLWKVTSPVYWLELRRRGVDVSREDPGILLKTVSYQPIGGSRDGYGYGHWLYFTIARSQRGERLLTIWRFDTDPADLVLWAEPGVLLANSCDRPILDLAPRSVTLPSNPPRAATLVLSARCAQSRRGYYILQVTGARVFTFASIHEDGETYLANWTFGHALNAREAVTGRGYYFADRVFKSPTEEAYLSYLRDLRQAPASPSSSSG